MPLVIVLVGLALFVLLVAYWKLNPFLSFVIVSIGIGVASGMDSGAIANAIQTGIGETLGSLVIILGFGAMLGKIIADSGAANQIATSLNHLFGRRYIQWGVVLTGFVVGLPLFFSVGFVILVPLVFTLGASTGLPVLFLGIPLLAALSVTHGLLPPHPAPTAITGSLQADMGMVLLYGVIIGIPAIIVGGPLFSRMIRKITSHPLPLFYRAEKDLPQPLPTLRISLLNALLPVVLLTLPSAVGFFSLNKMLVELAGFVGNPLMAMLLSLLFTIYTLGLRQGRSMTEVMDQCSEAIMGVAMLLLIIGGAGAFKEVLVSSGASQYVAGLLSGLDVSPLVLAWLIAAAIRFAVGSATVAAMTTVGIVTPLTQNSGADPNLMVLSIGAGSLVFSHLNDGGFWLVKEYFNLSIKETLRTWSLMEVIVAVAGLLGVLILDLIL